MALQGVLISDGVAAVRGWSGPVSSGLSHTHRSPVPGKPSIRASKSRGENTTSSPPPLLAWARAYAGEASRPLFPSASLSKCVGLSVGNASLESSASPRHPAKQYRRAAILVRDASGPISINGRAASPLWKLYNRGAKTVTSLTLAGWRDLETIDAPPFHDKARSNRPRQPSKRG